MNPVAVPAATAAAPSLAELRDIHLPANPSWWPLAPGWWLLAMLLAILLVWLLLRLRRRRPRSLPASRALQLLEGIPDPQAASEIPEFLGRINVLLRRVALARYPRESVASLSGDAWLAFLDRGMASGAEFRRGVGQILGDGPYRAHVQVDVSAVRALAHHWIRRQMGPLR